MIWFILVLVVAATVYMKVRDKKPVAVAPPVVAPAPTPTPTSVPVEPVKPPVTPTPTPVPIESPPPAPAEPVKPPEPPPPPAKPVVNYAVFAGETREGLEYKFKHGYAKMPAGFDWAEFEASGFMAQPRVDTPADPGELADLGWTHGGKIRQTAAERAYTITPSKEWLAQEAAAFATGSPRPHLAINAGENGSPRPAKVRFTVGVVTQEGMPHFSAWGTKSANFPRVTGDFQVKVSLLDQHGVPGEGYGMTIQLQHNP